MSEQIPGEPRDDTAPDRINIDYIKGNLFRTVRPDGLIGSLTPQGLLQLVFFAERQAIPQRVVYRLENDGALGEELEVVGRKAVVRELEVALTLDIETAQAVVRFLADSLREAAARKNGREEANE